MPLSRISQQPCNLSLGSTARVELFGISALQVGELLDGLDRNVGIIVSKCFFIVMNCLLEGPDLSGG